jgi:D-3-phosphoglycerate dehydrogenase
MVKIIRPFIPDHPTLISMSLQGAAGDIEQADFLLRSSVLGLLSAFHDVNVVNVMNTAERMGIRTEISRSSKMNSYLSCMELTVQTSGDEFSITGALMDTDKPRIVELNGYDLEFVPEGHVMITEHEDIPGMVGVVGTKLGSSGINIGTMHLGRKKVGEEAMMIILTDKEIPGTVVSDLEKIRGMVRVEVISL